MKQYLDMAKHVLEHGESRKDRTGTGTTSVFGYQNRYDLRKGFPCVTTKKLHMKSVIHELLWFLQGETNIAYLKENKVRIWDEWADADGELGPVYGKQWRSWPSANGESVDQITELVANLKSNPYSRRHLVNSWNVACVPEMALPPCHLLFQFYVSDPDSERPGLSCQLYQRSADLFLGVPFNIASYALLTMMVAQVCGYEAREFVHTFGDLHIYDNHMEQVKTQLSREPLELPTMEINSEVTDLLDFKYEDFKLVDYNPHPPIKGSVAV